MEYLVFNEASLPFTSKEEANTSFPIFLSIVNAAFKSNVKAILQTAEVDSGWYEVILADDYPVRVWLDIQEREYQRKVKSLIDRTNSPIISEEDSDLLSRFDYAEFVLVENEKIQVKSLGGAYFLRQPAISLPSQTWWTPYTIHIKHEQLLGDSIANGIVSVTNLTTFEQWSEFKDEIDKERKASGQQGQNLWNNRSRDFPSLVFCGDSPKQFQQLYLSSSVYNQLWTTLSKLNHYCRGNGNYSLLDIKEKTGLTISDESDSVKQNPKHRRHREFQIKGEKIFFGYHTKNFGGSLRLHFYPAPEENNIYIGYFGKHLPH